MLDKLKDYFSGSVKKELSEFTVIGRDSSIEGKIETNKLYIEGTFSPTYSSTFNTLQIGNGGVFKGEVAQYNHSASVLEIAGVFEGTVNADRVHIHSGAVVTGSVAYRESFICDAGATLDCLIAKI